MRPTHTLAAVTLLLAVGCTAAVSPTREPTPDATPTPAVSPTPEVTPVTPEADLPAAIMNPIYADVVERSGASLDQIAIVRAEAVVWPDPSLGCPQPGMVYPQVLVDGYWVVLEVDGTPYDYRGSGVGEFILCEIPPRDRFEPVPGNGGLDY